MSDSDPVYRVLGGFGHPLEHHTFDRPIVAAVDFVCSLASLVARVGCLCIPLSDRLCNDWAGRCFVHTSGAPPLGDLADGGRIELIVFWQL